MLGRSAQQTFPGRIHDAKLLLPGRSRSSLERRGGILEERKEAIMKKIVSYLLVLVLLCSLPAAVFADNFVSKNANTGSPELEEAILPDGTHLWLNSGTTISYPSDYGLSDRTVCLEEGEAFFDVTPDDGKAFRLHTKYGDIQVYGTSFDVCSYAEDKKFSVVLEEGAIEIFGKQGTSVTRMVPGQKYLYDTVSKGAKLFSCDAAGESVWRFGELKIERATLETLVHDMECWFGVEITLDNRVNDNQLYWMTIKTESLKEMLSLLNMIRPIRYKIDGKYVKITVL